MKRTVLAVSLISAAFSAHAAGLSCDDLKAKIEKKVESKGVKAYTLTVVAKDAPSKNRVVGACDKGSMKILYERVKATVVADKSS